MKQLNDISAECGLWTIFLGLTLLTLHFANLFLITVYAPLESTMGLIQKIFYYHVPVAWAAFLAFFFNFLGSLIFLIKKDEKYDSLAKAATETGMIFIILVLITGPIWARFTWGMYWTWEPRLTTSFVLFILYLAYVLLRRFGGEGERIARFAAVLGIVAFLDVPLVYFSMHWWAPEISAHPRSIGLSSEMKTVFFISLGIFTLTALYLLWERYRLIRLEHLYQQTLMKKVGK
ncbi:MAG TPA: cytochrome C assembly protein [Candidatus Marinimicrobia bacterium]|nr:cytochrome C assembly protein [Candidatus Neomarinimicrobiota bacterium]